MEYKKAQTKIVDVDEKGWVVFYPDAFGNVDRGDDILERGATQKTIKENFKNIRHFKSHNTDWMPGVIHEMSEDDYGTLTKSKLIMNTQLGRETHEEYKAMLEAGKTMDHSIGYDPIKIDWIKSDPLNPIRILKEIRLWEVSTLTAWGMNPMARTVDVKSFLQEKTLDELFKEAKYFELLLKAPFTDARLEQLEQLKNHVDSLIQKKAGIDSTLSNEPTVIQGSELIKNVKFF